MLFMKFANDQGNFVKDLKFDSIRSWVLSYHNLWSRRDLGEPINEWTGAEDEIKINEKSVEEGVS